MHRTIKLLALVAFAVAALPVKEAAAQFANGDLVLFFQDPNGGSGNTVYVNLGNAATNYRGAATGPDVANAINITNIASDLSGAFGAGWATNTNLFAGAFAARNNSSPLTNTAAVNGDANSLVYVSRARTSLGTEGIANSSGYSGFNGSGVQSIAGGILSSNSTTPAIAGTLALYDATVVPTSGTFLDTQNPVDTGNIQGNALNGNLAFGIQQQGSASSFSGSFGGVANVEFALDLYRIPATTGKPGQLAGDVVGTGTFEGTLVVDNTGNVSFVASAVPEPSTAMVLLAGLGALGIFRRRRTAAV